MMDTRKSGIINRNRTIHKMPLGILPSSKAARNNGQSCRDVDEEF